MADIFISYASDDRHRVIPVVKALENQGWSLFWDLESIPVAKTWRQFIQKGLAESKCVLVFWSEKSIDREWVIEEADHGKANKVLVPARLDNVPPPIGFRQIQAANLINWAGNENEPEFVKLLHALESILGPSPKQLKEKEQAAEEERKRQEAEEEARRERKAEAEFRAEEQRKREQAEEQRKTEEKRRLEEEQKRAEAEPKPEEERKRKADTKHNRKEADEQVLTRIAHAEKQAEIMNLITVIDRLVSKRKIDEQTNNKAISDIGIKFILIEPGTFLMGRRMNIEEIADHYGSNPYRFSYYYVRNYNEKSNDPEKPRHGVEIDQSFYLQTSPITQGQWQRIMGNNPSKFKACGEDCPVVNVSWEDAKKYIEKLNQIEKTKKYRLPSESEWEYACRAGSMTEFYFDDYPDQLGEFAWYSRNSNKKIHPVGKKQPNAWGLFDMHGNVWEWVEDDWHDNYEGAPEDDASAWIDNPRRHVRVMRGGSFEDDSSNCRSASRKSGLANERSRSVGFRLAMSIPTT
jgi:formylglycine-generating enzyme required for sulfatase activity